MAGLTIAYDAGTGPGSGATRPTYSQSGGRALKFVTGTIAFDSSYPTGGESITAIATQFTELLGVTFTPHLGYVFDVDYTAATQKVLAYYVDNNAAGDSAMIEVPDTTNLATLTAVHFLAYGF